MNRRELWRGRKQLAIALKCPGTSQWRWRLPDDENWSLPMWPDACYRAARSQVDDDARRLTAHHVLRYRIRELESCSSEFGVSRWRSCWESAR